MWSLASATRLATGLLLQGTLMHTTYGIGKLNRFSHLILKQLTAGYCIVCCLLIANSVTVYDRTVEEGKSTTIDCGSSVAPPFQYYRYFVKHTITQLFKPVYPAGAWQWNMEPICSVYISSYLKAYSSLQVIPNVVTSEHPLMINITKEYQGNMICCQGYSREQNNQIVSSLSTMICYRVNVQCNNYYSYIAS